MDDRKFAESYFRSECTNKGKPLIRIIAKLQEKGVDKHIIHDVIKESEEDIYE
ncbi:TPA: hypothetical protein DEP21_00835 [Patescibacteria group bacterium]|nr:hypothetical protein [Candidatus Gracilibacteria bacterium]